MRIQPDIMNTLKIGDRPSDTIWIGTAYVVPAVGSLQEKSGFIGGYAFFAFRSTSVPEGVANLYNELLEGGTVVVGFEWLSRLEDNDRELLEGDHEVIDNTDKYPTQFKDIHWFDSE